MLSRLPPTGVFKLRRVMLRERIARNSRPMSTGADHKIDKEIARARARLHALDAERMLLTAKLEKLERQPSLFKVEECPTAGTTQTTAVTSASSSAEKVSLFRRLFAGRADVFPIRWENRKTGKRGYAPACANEWVRGICEKPRVRCSECPHQAFIPVSDEVIERHLRGGDRPGSSGGDFVAGVYPLLPDESCWFLAADFDNENWAADASAVLETSLAKGIPAALERSRSGNGGHIWVFFSEPTPARIARQPSPRLWSAVQKSASLLMIGSFQARIQCRSAALEI
jgi:hypothetical protein